MLKNSFQETTQDLPDDSLSITKKNRHQYYETAIVQASEADRQIRHAEARGKQRQARELALKKKLTQIALVLLGVVVVSAALITVLLMR